MIPTARIAPLHEVLDAGRVAELVASMTADGWTGRPLIVYSDDTMHYQALTGSHRWAAAVSAGLAEIPCVVLSDDHMEALGEYLNAYGVVLAEDGYVAMQQAGDADIAALWALD